MDNQKLIELITNWRNMAYGLTNKEDYPEFSISESCLVASTMEQCADELGDLLHKET